MPRKLPLDKLKEAADAAVGTVVGVVAETVKDPVGTGQKMVGRAVATVGTVGGRVGRNRAATPTPAPVAEPRDAPLKVHGDAVAPSATKGAATKAPVKKAAVKKTATKKTATKKTAAKKAAAKKTAAKKTAARTGPSTRKPPLTASELVEDAATEVTTPVGTTGADVATNPDTTDHDLQQVGTEPLVDPSLAKAVASEAATMARAADRHPGESR